MYSLGLRVTGETKAILDARAALSGRSQSGEAVHLIEMGILMERLCGVDDAYARIAAARAMIDEIDG